MPTDDPRPAFKPTWPTCEKQACTGAVVFGGHCLAHLGGSLDPYLGRLGPGSDIDARGTVLEESLVRRLLGGLRGADRTVFGNASFEHARFLGVVQFDNIVFGGRAVFDHARFDEQARFIGADFRAEARFHDTTFAGTIQFDNIRAGVLEFVNARCEKRAWFGPLVADELIVARVRCAAITEIDVRVERLNGRFARYEEGVVIRADGGDIFAEQARFGGSSLISGTGALPRLRSLRATDVSNLEVADVDLRWCAFAGAHRLDQLRLSGRCPFGRPPRGGRTRRRTIAEESAWREWPTDRPGHWEIESVDPERMANVYRSLRKAFEDSKNEAGAGDFYYGEMEMRRHSTDSPRAERAILWVYWLLSGYGQRAARALAALVVLIVTVGTLLAVWGQPVAEAAQIAVGAVVLREPGAELTEAGQWTVMVARVLGPVLLALAILAVRARVKR
ncbi:MAG: pentapeptide repeat-containing protein [Actinophytocola sp.]|uniref:pentapeptide repeat-containing protein n=1 Tax=Actinophytocola sp. TaxID=1872138 RepID=UPI003D6A4A04